SVVNLRQVGWGPSRRQQARRGEPGAGGSVGWPQVRGQRGGDPDHLWKLLLTGPVGASTASPRNPRGVTVQDGAGQTTPFSRRRGPAGGGGPRRAPREVSLGA